MIIPAIDLKNGEVVRLRQGDMARSTVYGSDPAAAAWNFAEQGAELIHVVDLDGAIAGTPRNLDVIRKIRSAANCRIEVSGGLRTIESVREIAAAGADFISIGSAAFLNPELLPRACTELPGRVFGSVDVREGRLAIRGWVETSEMTIAQAIERFQQAGVAALIVTDISRDGTQDGPNMTLLFEVASKSQTPLIASGGVASLDDIRTLSRQFQSGIAGVIIGRAIYERRFTLSEALSAADQV
ncbi:MAG: 1-(5-phosphoribosyl)-5-[(5-phosphoribosylamino)methylideneamino]imidazole-4-carboxamide isomerase [Deltaproteobacteria bacterium]|nr:1-(5-phosphoribosyl)-5-[(5-phosphoribosylamino)methylideneamino]imidazole-4-carboxamide isomerase [Deltaproteobacteria bacterium]